MESSQYSLRQNVAWKEESYSTMTQVLSISYLWQPVLTIVSTVVFGLLFSLIVNIFQKPPRVKAKYMTPIIMSMYKKILSAERLNSLFDFDDDDEEEEYKGDDDATTRTVSVRNSISTDSLYVR